MVNIHNFRNMCAIFQAFPNRNALRTELSWALPLLPSEEELRKELERERRLLTGEE